MEKKGITEEQEQQNKNCMKFLSQSNSTSSLPDSLWKAMGYIRKRFNSIETVADLEIESGKNISFEKITDNINKELKTSLTVNKLFLIADKLFPEGNDKLLFVKNIIVDEILGQCLTPKQAEINKKKNRINFIEEGKSELAIPSLLKDALRLVVANKSIPSAVETLDDLEIDKSDLGGITNYLEIGLGISLDWEDLYEEEEHTSMEDIKNVIIAKIEERYPRENLE